MKLAAGLTVIAFVCSTVLASEPTQRTLTFDDRVAAQKAIEQVYWNHRIWPKENPGPKPPLAAVMTDEVLRQRVAAQADERALLGSYWHTHLTGADVQSEIDRMIRGSKDPAMLRELFAALGNDPVSIAECLARPLLEGRLVEAAFARDARIHGAQREKIAQELAGVAGPAGLKRLSGRYAEVTVALKGETKVEARHDPETGAVLELEPDEWNELITRLSGQFGVAPPGVRALSAGLTTEQRLASLPIRVVAGLDERDDAFVASAVLDRHGNTLRLASASWPKIGLADWMKSPEGASALSASPSAPDDGNIVAPQGGYTAAATSSVACVDDSWKTTWMVGLVGRTGHTAVWTGTEMIVWGGNGNAGSLNTGDRYNPSTDSWASSSLTTGTGANVPSARASHTAVWTGTEMIVWGGWNGGTNCNTGGRYNPLTDSWASSSLIAGTGANVPSARSDHTAVWTGTEMIVWGGAYGGAFYNTGGRYNPSTDSWAGSSLTTGSGANVPSGRYLHTAVWTGTEMVVWGGYRYAYLNTGGRYNPSTDTWANSSLTTGTGANVPSGRLSHTAVWTGTEMIVWGGYSSGYYNTGGRYNPSTDSWASSSLTTGTGANVPSARESHTVVWTGMEMIVWGGGDYAGHLNTGGRYNPSKDSWANSSLTIGSGANVPSARESHTAVWTGTEMIVWGGGGNAGSLNTGGRYNPSTDSWASSSLTSGSGANVPSARSSHTAVWTGTEMIVWGGAISNGSYLNTGGRYNPSTDSWASSSLTTGSDANVPSARSSHTAVWTGTEMIVWGGYSSGYLNTGGRYNPSTDRWASSSLTTGTGANVPSARESHTAVWTGTEMLVWGGYGGDLYNTGGRYNPSTDSWATSSLTSGIGSNVPSGRSNHTAVWTGTEMIVWGGYGNAGSLNTGGRYNPSTDSWASSSLTTGTGANAPAARYDHTAVWTGAEMIVWGGQRTSSYFNTGGRYNPSTDSWSSSSLTTGAGANVPSARYSHTAVWMGTEMIVWGGTNFSGVYLNTGGGYNPSTDSWASSSLTTGTGANVPSLRTSHTAVWTGTEMIVWGGYGSGELNTGGRYNPSTDSWASSSLFTGPDANAPSARYDHTTVWTGAEMIVWGGQDGTIALQTGGRYVPATDSWVPSVLDTGMGANTPAARWKHTAVWTGTELVVWGGSYNDGALHYLNTGGRYSPATDSWASSSLTTGTGANVPSARQAHRSVWTGTKMIAWGGYGDAGYLNTGGRYDPVTDGWLTTGTGANVPSGREPGASVWTGTEMIVWGGWNGGTLGDGARYAPATDAWIRVSAGANAPAARGMHAAVWTGTEMLVWGGWAGVGSNTLSNGGRYNPSTDTWAPSSLTSGSGVNVPPCREYPTAVWTGTEMIVWGGDYTSGGVVNYTNTGGRYNPFTDTWATSSLTNGTVVNTPSVREYHTAVLAGPLMIVWGGYDGTNALGDGAAYCTATCSNVSWYEDLDGDGYGNALASTVSCTQPHGYVAISGDCDDTNPAVHAGVAEICNGIDDDCDGVVDDGAEGALCNDGNACTDDACNGASGCTHTNNTAPCNDGNACTQSDMCGSGVCVGSNPVDCTASACRDAGACDPGTGLCSNPAKADGTSCSDGNVCTIGDTCVGGNCSPGTLVVCDDNNVCTTDSCNPSAGCVYTNNTASCNDGNACTLRDACQDGVCVGSHPVVCTASDQCHDDGTCDPGTGLCSNPPKMDGTPCNDASLCTAGETCMGGVCSGGVPINCNDGNPCTNDSCNSSGVCVHTNNTSACDDGNVCTTGDRCGGGACNSGTPINCDDGNACTDDICDAVNGCQHVNNTETCDDGNLCTLNDTCSGGLCHAGPLVVCNDFNPCTSDICHPEMGCVSTNNTTACDDGDPCTTGDTCSGGACSGTPVGGPPEVQNVAVAADKTTYNWSAVVGALRYDVVRGSTGAFPVGPDGGDEVCFDNLAGTSLTDSAVPPPGSGFWYLSRGENACGIGTLGNRSNGSPRATTCP